MGKDQYLEALQSLPLFSALNKKDLQRIAKVSDEVEVDAGKVIVSEGQTGHEAYLIQDGAVDVERSGKVIASLGPGDHFGELAIFDGGARTATVKATSTTRLLVIGQRELVGVIDEVPGIAIKLLDKLAGRIRGLDEKAYG